jgi:hypothetical protein
LGNSSCSQAALENEGNIWKSATEGQFHYADHIHNQFKFLRSFPGGKNLEIFISRDLNCSPALRLSAVGVV